MIKQMEYEICYEDCSYGATERVFVHASTKEERNRIIKNLRKEKTIQGIAWRAIYKNGKIEWHDGRKRVYNEKRTGVAR